jgi:RNA polymerase sigma-70 factor (ECF subfamily)
MKAMRSTESEGEVFRKAALEQLDALFGYAMTLTRNRTEAEDLVQETFLRAVRAFGELVPDSNLKAWLFVIMRNVWLNQLRHDKSGPRFVEIEGDEEGGFWFEQVADDPHSVYVSKVTREEVQIAIGRLPRLYREVVVLRDIEGFSYQQIARILSCPAGTVMSRLGRARQRLRTMLIHWHDAARPKSIPAKKV